MVTADRCVWRAVLMSDWLSRSKVGFFSPSGTFPSVSKSGAVVGPGSSTSKER